MYFCSPPVGFVVFDSMVSVSTGSSVFLPLHKIHRACAIILNHHYLTTF